MGLFLDWLAGLMSDSSITPDPAGSPWGLPAPLSTPTGQFSSSWDPQTLSPFRPRPTALMPLLQLSTQHPPLLPEAFPDCSPAGSSHSPCHHSITSYSLHSWGCDLRLSPGYDPGEAGEGGLHLDKSRPTHCWTGLDKAAGLAGCTPGAGRVAYLEGARGRV